jgi:hypothetical protein
MAHTFHTEVRGCHFSNVGSSCTTAVHSPVMELKALIGTANDQKYSSLHISISVLSSILAE